MLPVIHFTKLSELLNEFKFYGDVRQIVRVGHSQRTETKSGLVDSLTVYTIQVFARAIHHGAILSYTAMSESISHSVLSNPAESKAKYDQAWEDVAKVKTGLFVAIREAGHEYRDGIIDLGECTPIVGEQWPLSE